MSLNLKQQRFADEYAVDLNATQAAIRAGYAEHTAYSQGQRLLKHVEVAQAIADQTQKHATATRITAEAVLNGLWEIATNGEREANRVRSWELLGKHLALFTERVELTQVPSSDMVRQWIDALTADIAGDA